MKERYSLHAQGIVQGVGFRPFVFNLAERLGLSGWVLNSSAGVFMEIQGDAAACAEFRHILQSQPPPLARIDCLICTQIPILANESGFHIKESATGVRQTLISADMAVCQDCLTDLADPHSRMYRYPFVNCTNCGPRFTIIGDIPYDRANTTMKDFPLCDDCARDFADPHNRRFHAQPIACPACGPHLSFIQAKTGKLIAGDPLQLAASWLRQGKILAVKGLGGYHLACDPFNQEAVCLLRQRKNRYDKPLALMAASLTAAEKICIFNNNEKDLLLSRRRPIVLALRRPQGLAVAEAVAPGNRRLGIFLPYTPMHHLLLQSFDALVMTSGNLSDEPIAWEDEDAFYRLSALADAFLTHNRRIYRRCDDSVAVWAAGAPRLLRRSRGYVPEPLPVADQGDLLALGGQQSNTFCLLRQGQGFVSQHIGDLDDVATYEDFRRQIQDFCRIFEVKPQIVVYDKHPQYVTARYAQESGLPLLSTQHHHAHLASVLAEYGLKESVLALIFDGTGYGDDGALWGGEVLLGDRSHYTRLAHLAYTPLPGGEMAIRQPWRMAMSYLSAAIPEQELDGVAEICHWPRPWSLLWQATKGGLNAPLSSGMGRLFDAAAAIAGFSGQIRYQGQAAIFLEHLAWQDQSQGAYVLTLTKQGLIDWRPMFQEMLRDKRQGVSPPVMAGRFHRSIANLAVELAICFSRETGVRRLALSGGCWQNLWLLEHVYPRLQKLGFSVYANRAVPVNDGGLALGQAAIGAAYLAGNRE